MNITNLSFEEVERYSESLSQQVLAKSFSDLLTERKAMEQEMRNAEKAIEVLDEQIMFAQGTIAHIKDVLRCGAFKYQETKKLIERINTIIDDSGFEL